MKKIGRIVLVTALVGSMLVTPVYAAPSVNELEQSKAAAESAVDTKQKELIDLLVKMDELETELIEKGQEITKAGDELVVAQEKEKEQYEAMKIRIKYMYEEGNNTSAEKILTSESIADVLNQAEYVKNIHTYDRAQLQEYVATKEQVVELKDGLEKDAKKLEELQVNFKSEEESLNNTIATKQAEVSNFDEQIQAAAAAAAAERQAAIEAQAKASTSKSNDGGTQQRPSANPPSNSNQGSNSGATESNGSGGAAIVNAARGFLGVPYVWGGESGSGVDCSGLVLLAHRSIGVSLSHSSGAQGGGGKAVNGMANALPGDVVCYSGHVGIYIGGGQMIHAPQAGDVVKVANVFGSPWFRRYW